MLSLEEGELKKSLYNDFPLKLTIIATNAMASAMVVKDKRTINII